MKNRYFIYSQNHLINNLIHIRQLQHIELKSWRSLESKPEPDKILIGPVRYKLRIRRPQISERADKNHATQVFASMTIGSTRMEENLVGYIECDPT